MEEIWLRIIDNLSDRVSGPMHFRIVLQPIMAIIFAVLSGLKDAKLGNPPYFWGLINNPTHRIEILKNGWRSVGKVFILAIILDIIYQIIVLHFIYPGEAIIVAFILAILPYLIIRGLVTRVVFWFNKIKN